MTQPALFVGEVRVVLEDAHVHLVGFARPHSRSTGDQPVSHIVMSNEAFRRLLAEGRVSLAKGGH